MPPAADAQPFRVSDAERNQAAERINGCFAEGRLDVDETLDRLDQVYAAKTDAELARVLADLPSPAPRAPARSRRRLQPRPLLEQAAKLATPGLICTAVWAMTGHGSFWPEWVWLATGVGVLQRVRHHQRARPPAPPELMAGTAPAVLTAVFVQAVGPAEGLAAVVAVQRHGGQQLVVEPTRAAATFTSPSAALDYAAGVRAHAQKAGLAVRIGVHTGELRQLGAGLDGTALYVGRALCDFARPGEVLASSIVHDLCAEAGYRFVDQGVHEVANLPGTWHLYALES